MSDQSEPQFVFGYWSIRGLGATTRKIFHHFNVKYEDKRYDMKPMENGWDRSEWLNVKEKMDLDFPNLPYLIDKESGLRLTQSTAINRFLWYKFSGKWSKNPEEEAILTMVEQELVDMGKRFTALSYNPKFDELKEGFLSGLPYYLDRFEKFLGIKKFLLGDEVHYVDYLFHEILDCHQLLHSPVLENHPKLQAYFERIENLPSTKAYKESPSWIKHPINALSAYFK